MDSADFIVIGAGIAGASVAAELSIFGSVCLLEAESQPGYHSTGRSAALFSEIYGNRVIRNLSRASRKQMFEPLATFGAGPWTTPRGALYVATSEQADQLLRQAEHRDVLDSVRYLTGEETQALCPVLRPGYAAVGLYELYASDINVHGLHQAYLRQCRQNGGFLSNLQRVEEITRSGGLWEVRSSTGSFTAPTIINAAGAWADQIALLAGVLPVGLQPMRRTALLVDAPEGRAINAWPLVIAADESFYFKTRCGPASNLTR